MAKSGEASLKKPLWTAFVNGRVAHAVIDDGLDTVCGRTAEIAIDRPKSMKRCLRCLDRLHEAEMQIRQRKTP